MRFKARLWTIAIVIVHLLAMYLAETDAHFIISAVSIQVWLAVGVILSYVIPEGK